VRSSALSADSHDQGPTIGCFRSVARAPNSVVVRHGAIASADPQNADPCSQDTTMKKHTLQSAILAVALMFGTSATMTVGHALVAPSAAQAGVLGKIKGAAKTVSKGAAKGIAAAGRGVQTAGNAVGKGAKIVGKGIVRTNTTVAKAVGGEVKRAAVAANKAAFQTPVGRGLSRAVGAVRRKI
jgi:hypothetical protein